MLDRCGPKDDKAFFQLQIGRCLFLTGKYREAASKLEGFIADYKANKGTLVADAVLMIGQTYIQLGQLDKAVDSFLGFIIEYPEAPRTPDANFFIGYCYMLQGKIDAATEAFDVLIKAHPDSASAGKARMCLRRIKSQTK